MFDTTNKMKTMELENHRLTKKLELKEIEVDEI